MKQILLMACLIFCIPSFGSEVDLQPISVSNSTVTQPQSNPLTIPQNIQFESCTKMFGINQERLFYLTLASISANRFKVEEIQSDMGYIIFSANRNKYLATIGKIDNTNAILKITPCNNIYRFPPGILTNLYKYIELNGLEK